MMSNRTLRIIVIADNGSGIKFTRMIPRPEILLTDAWLGTRKKNTAAAMIASAAVRIRVSLSRERTSTDFFLFYLLCLEYTAILT